MRAELAEKDSSALAVGGKHIRTGRFRTANVFRCKGGRWRKRHLSNRSDGTQDRGLTSFLSYNPAVSFFKSRARSMLPRGAPQRKQTQR